MKISNPSTVLGEDLAIEFLKNYTYKTLEQNLQKNYGEIDIIAIDESDKKDKTFVFVEVNI